MNPKLKSILINVALFAVVVFLAIKLIQSIKAPIDFANEKKLRETEVVQRLKDIRDAETFFKQENNRYTASFDTLIQFCSTHEIALFKTEVNYSDTAYLNAHGEYKVDTTDAGSILVMDSLFGGRANFNINDLGIVPFGDPDTTKFELQASVIDKNGIKVPVFEVKTPFEVYLSKPGKKFTEKEWSTRVKNTKAELEQLDRYAGLKVGSLEEASTDGNWEKL